MQQGLQQLASPSVVQNGLLILYPCQYLSSTALTRAILTVGTNNKDDISAMSFGGLSFTIYWWLCTPPMSGPMLHRETEDIPQTAERITWKYFDDRLAWTSIVPPTWYKGPESKMLKRFSNLNASVTVNKTLCEFYHRPHFHVKAIECGLYPFG